MYYDSESFPTVLSDLVKYESNPDYTREVLTLLAGSGGVRTLAKGKIVKYVPTVGAGAVAVGDFNGAIGTITPGALAEPGVYTLIGVAESANAGTMEVYSPSGERLPDLTIAAAYTGAGHFGVTIADGSEDLDNGDVILITLSVPKAEEVTITDAAKAYGVVIRDAEAADGVDDKVLVVSRGEVILEESKLSYPASAAASDKAVWKQHLARKGIIVKTGV